MVHSCCAFGCKNVFRTGTGLGFFRFPYRSNRRLQWTLALRRKNFIPSSSTRICGAHFQTGRPSRDVNHPDYVPNIFVFNDDFEKEYRRKQSKRRFKKELVEDVRELPFLNSQMEDQELSSEDTSSDSDTCSNEYPKFDQEFLPEFDAEVRKSSIITKNTIKCILANDAINNPDAVPDKYAIYGKNRFPPKKFTFIDVNGKLLAKFTERRLRKNTPFEKRRHHPIFSSHTVKQTVQVIVDKKNAKTAYVDIDSITDFSKDFLKVKKESDDEDYSDVNNSYIDAYLNADYTNDFPEIKEEIDDEDDSGVINNSDSNTFPDTDYADDFCSNQEIGEEYYAHIRNNLDDAFPDTAQQPHTIRISNVFGNAPQNTDDKADADLFSWYSEIRTLNNRNAA